MKFTYVEVVIRTGQKTGNTKEIEAESADQAMDFLLDALKAAPKRKRSPETAWKLVKSK